MNSVAFSRQSLSTRWYRRAARAVASRDRGLEAGHRHQHQLRLGFVRCVAALSIATWCLATTASSLAGKEQVSLLQRGGDCPAPDDLRPDAGQGPARATRANFEKAT